MTVAEVSKLIEERVSERTLHAKRIWGVPLHIAVEIEPRIAEINREIQELQLNLWRRSQK
jgi:hypothetical protein